MPPRTILRLGDPRLWRVSEPAPEAKADRVQETIRDLDETLRLFREETGWGRGISAVQIGEMQRIAFIHLPGGERFAFLNPQVIDRSDEQIDLWDNCFSFPGLEVRVRRHYRIAFRYTDHLGKAREMEVEGGLSELVQHEFDHLDGVLAINRRIDDRSFRMTERL